MWAEIVRNVEFYGGCPGKRLGTSYVNSCLARVTDTWVNVPAFILDTSHLDVDTLGGDAVFQGPVDRARCVEVGATVTVIHGDIIQVATVAAVVGQTVTLDGLSVAPMAGDALLVRHPLNGNARIDGLFQANFRSGLQALIAACGDGLFAVRQAPVLSTRLTEQFPVTTVDATWGGTTTGTLANVETIRADGSFGEHIQIAGAGPDGGVYEGRVTVVDFSTRTITVAPPTTTPPASGAAVTLFQRRVPSDTHFVQHANLTHVVAELTPPVKITPGLFVQRHGVLPPIGIPVAIAIAGSLTGTYTYRQKFRNSTTGQESEPGPEMAGPAVYAGSGGRIPLSTSPDPQVDQVRLYRTTDGGAGSWYFLAELPNGTPFYDDTTITDDGLGALMREFLDNVMPDGVGDSRMVTVLALWAAANRLVGCDTTLGSVPYSDELDLSEGFLKPEAWPPLNFLLVNYDDGDKPRANASFFDSLMTFKERSVFRVLGVPPDLTIQPVIFRQDLTGVGSFNQKAVVVDQNELIFPGQDGFYLVSRYQGVQQGFQSERLSRAIDGEWARLVQGGKQRAHGVFFRERRQLRVWLPFDLGEEPNEGLVYQFEGSVEGVPLGWAEWDVAAMPDGTATPSQWPKGYTASCVARFRNGKDVVFVGTRTGDVLRMDQGAAELDVFPYNFQYRTVQYTPSGPGLVCRLRGVDLVSVAQTNVALKLRLATDFYAADDTLPGSPVDLTDAFGPAQFGEIDVPLAPAGSGFILDVSHLDVDRLGGGAVHRRDRIIALARGEYHRLEWAERSNTALFRLQAWTEWFQTLPAQVQSESVVQTL